MPRKLLLLLALLLASCASAPRPVRVTIEELPTDRWRVAYTLPQPATSVTFARDRATFRGQRWTIAGAPGARWTTKGDQEAIEFAAPVSRFTLELASDFESKIKDYSLHLAFTDGSRLMYTGHFLLEGMQHRFSFRSNREVRTPGGEEGYVYFGSIAPVQTERMTLVVDPGLPPWMAKQLTERVPPVFDYFATQTKTELGFRPLVYVSYGETASSGMSFKGGVVGRGVQVSITGGGWAAESAAASRMWFNRMAHEVFHLWESGRFHGDDGTEWLSEASAEYAALLASRHGGQVDDAGMHRMIVESANECIAGLGDLSLVSSVSKGNYRNVYACGLVSQWLAAHATGDWWALVRRTFDRPRDYTTADYIETLRAMTSNPGPVERLVAGRTLDVDRSLAAYLRRSGVNVSLVPLHEATAEQRVLREVAAGILGRCACRLKAAATCGDPARAEVDGFSVRSKPREVIEALQRHVEEKTAVKTAEGELRCTAADLDRDYDRMLRLE